MTRLLVAAVLSEANKRLVAAGIESAARDARILMAHAMKVPPDRITLYQNDQMSDDQKSFFISLLEDRLKRKPISHLIGERQFYGRGFVVTPDVLDPRPETETIIELALQEPFDRVLDMGVGSGAILVTLLAEMPNATGVGTDISDKAVLIAGENADRHGVAERITLPISTWFDDVGSRYDLIVSNPPYIAADEMDDLQPEVRDHEPREALTDEADGLTAYRVLAKHVPNHLLPGGRLLVEIGPTQAEAVKSLFENAGLRDISVHKDLDKRDRVVLAWQGN